MKTLYLECNMGAAGDMLTAALLELLPEERQKEVLDRLQNLGLEGVEIKKEKVTKCGIAGTHMKVTVNGEEEVSEDVDHEHHHDHEHCHDHEHDHDHDHCHDHSHNHDHDHDHNHEHDHHDHAHHHHHHTSIKDVEKIIYGMALPFGVKMDAVAVYKLIAEAESNAHGMPVEEVHFHEVGSKDAIMDVVAVCLLMHEIDADNIFASPVHVGSGQVRCAHGIMPVPAPATEYLLRGIPSYQGNIKGELCTPTGAALLKHFVTKFGPRPMMNVDNVGIGCGMKDFEAANCVRAFLGDLITEETPGKSEKKDDTDTVFELNANVDDMTAEEIGFACDRIFDAGAREVFTESVYMKKNRPGTLITVICDSKSKESVLEAFFKHTTTIGIREKECNRYVLSRSFDKTETEFGTLTTKTSSGYGTKKTKVEYDDAAEVALKHGMTLREARELINR
ncbi:MAG: nickel pincer cofactor biosynthesis protein LarC [Acetatifactor sp.]|nr:nickel pincer cofactor biosynthesis protein LarC [Acetatifactor sp.]